MNALDWVVVGALGVSVLLGILRGFVREALAVAGWVAGIALALRYSVELGMKLPFDVPVPALRTGIGALAIVVASVFIGALAGWIVRRLIEAARLSAADRALGALFGVARAVLIVFAVVFFASGTTVARGALWRESALLPPIEAAVRFASPYLPESFARPAQQ
ncbi:MAG: colicin V production protein [Burkholderiaceae bacterium]